MALNFCCFRTQFTKFYIDDQIVGSINYSVSSPIVAIGNNGGNGVAPQNAGNIDMPTIWDYALNVQEIQQYMDCPPTGNETGLIGFWNFEEGQGSTVLDLTSNNNHGTINSASYNMSTPIQSCSANQLITVNGCDSVALLNLIINNSSID